MDDWEKSKQMFVDKLDNADRIFTEIFRIDSDGLVVQGDERAELEILQEENKKILKKLKSREFTVAIVGLENAGKSTLGNALIKSMVLPEYSERCTYTTTEIRAGSRDVAEVYFYSRDEFNKNFRRMLDEVEYPDAANFDTMTFTAFETFWKAVETNPKLRGIYLLYNATTAADIKTILKGKDKILELLKNFGGGKREFGAEYWNNNDGVINDFKIFITGISGFEKVKNEDGTEAKVAVRAPHPYVVKKVIVRSTQLKDMSHIVLYDVPGFDSPTELHKRQTEEMLKESDAIILVTNLDDKPNLNGPQLDMLRKGQDKDGVKLSEKAFVFGNKIDKISSVEMANDHTAVLRNEAVKNQIALSNHIVGGSARAYLEIIGLIKNRVASSALIKQNKSGDIVTLSDGIEILRDKMQTYYDNDRFAVLKRRAESTLTKTRTVLQNLLDRYSTGELNPNDAGTEIIQEIQSRLPQFTNEANRITKTHTTKIFSERPFTNALKEDVANVYPLVEEAYLQLVQDTADALAIDSDGVYPTSTVDGNVRNKLGIIFIENIVKNASKFTTERQRELRQDLIDSFLKIMGVETTTSYRAELNESVNKLFDDMLVKGGEECNFNSLVERFVMTLIQTLITQPFAAESRCQKVKEALDELVSLSVYYNMPTDKDAKKDLRLGGLISGGDKFFTKILAHEGVEPESELDATKNENFLRELFEENHKQICEGERINLSSLPFGEWAKTLTRSGINLAQIKADKSIKARDKLDNKLEDLFYSQNWAWLDKEQKLQAVEKVIENYAAQGINQNKYEGENSLLAQLDGIQQRAREIHRMNSKDEMISTLNTDIKILRDITTRAVINAIGLERAFNSVIIKNVDLIRNHLNEPEGNVAYRAWIRNNAVKLMPSRFEQIIEQGAIRENKKAIVNAVRKLLNDWN